MSAVSTQMGAPGAGAEDLPEVWIPLLECTEGYPADSMTT